MIAPDAASTRASLEVARVALGRMTGAPPAPGAQRSAPMTMAARASDAWMNCEIVLRILTKRPELGGAALLTEARRVDSLDMPGMHALVAMREWVERTLAPGSAAQMLTLPPTEAERDVATHALAALERAVSVAGEPGTPDSRTSAMTTPDVRALSQNADSRSVLPPPDAMPRSAWAPQPIRETVTNVNVVTPKAPSAWSPPDRVSSTPHTDVPSRHAPTDGLTNGAVGGVGNRSASSGLIMTALLLVVLIASGSAFFYFKGRSGATSSATDEGAAAYARGSKEAARLSFVKAVEQNADDARALTYLGRISREQGSLATARLYLEKAIRVEPNNALASRELGSALLADEQYELARRFYVRALTLNPTDRTAQGLLGCTLFKLKRIEEARNWMNRAGAGEWSGCAPTSATSLTKD